MKHTPGPWIAPKGQTNLVCAERDWKSQQIGALKHGFQATVSLQQGEAQAAADARLIAAAPELLEALIGLIEIGKRDMSNPKYDSYFDFAKLAIAKATGGAE